MGPKKRKLRSEELFGGCLEDLPDTCLPTYRDIAKYSYFLKETGTDLGQLHVVISQELLKKWTKVSDKLPFIKENSIQDKVERFINQLQQRNRKHATPKAKKSMDQYFNKIFDISKCSCSLLELDSTGSAIKCKVPNCSNVHITCLCPEKVITLVLLNLCN